MGDKSKIEWTDATWNPILGCSKISAGCKNCYAIRTAHRLQQNPNPKIAKAFKGLTKIEGGKPNWTGRINFVPDRLDQPLRWKEPRMIFVNSQSDLFHERLGDSDIVRVFGVMASAPQHVFQVLTKRPGRMQKLLSDVSEGGFWCEVNGEWYNHGHRNQWHCPALPNVWLGVSCENQTTADERIPLLLQTPAAVRWVSAEPLLGPIDFRFPTNREAHEKAAGMGLDPLFFAVSGIDPNQRIGDGINWIVVGGESGADARPMHPDWARSLRDQCQAAGVPFFFKQWGVWAPGEIVSDGRSYPTKNYFNGAWSDCSDDWTTEKDSGPILYRVGKKAAGRLLDGREWAEWPKSSAVSEG